MDSTIRRKVSARKEAAGFRITKAYLFKQGTSAETQPQSAEVQRIGEYVKFRNYTAATWASPSPKPFYVDRSLTMTFKHYACINDTLLVNHDSSMLSLDLQANEFKPRRNGMDPETADLQTLSFGNLNPASLTADTYKVLARVRGICMKISEILLDQSMRQKFSRGTKTIDDYLATCLTVKTSPPIQDKLYFLDKVDDHFKVNSKVWKGCCGPRDIARLSSGQWINDHIINHFIDKFLLTPHGLRPDILVFNTYFFTQHLFQTRGQLDVKCMRRWTPLKVIRECGADPSSWKRFVFPINFNNCHWKAACVDFEAGSIIVYDSWNTADCGRTDIERAAALRVQQSHNREIVWLAQRLVDALLWENKQPPMVWSTWTFQPHFPVPQFQNNNYDCGIFTLTYLMHVYHGDLKLKDHTRLPAGWDTGGDVDDIRLYLASELVKDGMYYSVQDLYLEI
ncbi:uncharacterized protein EV420DRAFT_1485881 [Desarmillaria tabescens]|uniref:Ubiquitin-like protease family profile domain-containing protein n=1 Tax=Armillaria tabescens TaxID=1929756 RepID=A0AA39MNQ0_ARMTA|nr:uncharacterized protein EV420DRAFT_1485881 [Desarmillaria tabescens]KAK0440673.1 hypothetical protein EV420DRAFT_1485881 [Desarmillaria tabescens]